MARTVALLSELLSPSRTSGPVLKLSPSTAQFMPRNWEVAALAGAEVATAIAGSMTRAASMLTTRR